MAWRIWIPFAELRKRGYIAHSVASKDSERFLPRIAAGIYNVIVTPRLAWPEHAGKPWQRAIRNAGLTWVYEVDDDVYSPSIVHRQYRIFPTEHDKGLDGLERDRQERIRVINQADAITVSCRRLKTIVETYTEVPVYVVPNAIDARWFRQVLRGISRLPELADKITIGWAGGTRDVDDLLVMAEAWRIIAEKYPQVHFVVQGFIVNVLDALPKERRTTLPWLDLSEYPRALVNIDIGCCAVAPNVFNSAKSAIKWYEFTLAGAACVVSSTLYGPVVTDGQNALVASTVDEWVAQLSRLIENEDERRRIADNARTTVMTEHSLDNNWWRWPAAWQDAIEQTREKNSRKLVLAR